MEENSSSGKKWLKLNKKILGVLLVLVLLVLAGISIYYYSQFQKTKNLAQNPNKAVTEETQVLISKIGGLIQLPVDEEPTIATVSDKSKLLNQPFFTNAENGDKVLIYPKAKKAILYRPNINKIIEVSSVNFQSDTQPQASVETATPSPAVTSTPTPTTFPLDSAQIR